MNLDPTSLDRLHDLVVPPPVPWWPPAPGWLWLLGIASIALLGLTVAAFVHFQRNRYRREAFAELERLEAMLDDEPQRPAALASMAELLKRCALTAYSRERVANLTGPPWFAFLDHTAGTAFHTGIGATLEAALYGGGMPDAATLGRVAGEVRNWVRQHGDPPPAGSAPAAASSPQTATERRAA